MAEKGPIEGVRIPVKLPFKGATDKKDQFSSIKLPVAKYLKFDAAKKSDLEYEVEVKKKDEDGKKVSGEVKVKRRRRPGYRSRSVTIFFGDVKTSKRKKVKIGDKSVYSTSFPITNSVAISDVINYFESGKGKGLEVIRIVDANSGQGYPIIPDF